MGTNPLSHVAVAEICQTERDVLDMAIKLADVAEGLPLTRDDEDKILALESEMWACVDNLRDQNALPTDVDPDTDLYAPIARLHARCSGAVVTLAASQ